MDHWALWTLLSLHKHLDRQKWVGFIVESRLKGDLQKIGCAGAFGHPEGLPQSGDVPDEPEWKYFFHGCGCCLTNKTTGASIDVDFTREGHSDKIDRFFYSHFLLSLAAPEFPERMIRREEPFQHSWQVEIDRLGVLGCVKAEHGLRLTADGVRLAETIEPLTKHITRLLEWGTSAAVRNAMFAALALGDVVLANQLVAQTDVAAELRDRLFKDAGQSKESRLGFLRATLRDKNSYAPSSLAAIGDLGPEFSEAIVTSYLFQSPVTGAANTALEIIRAWNLPNVCVLLKELLDRRYSEATGFRTILTRIGFSSTKQNDRQPRSYQTTHATLALFQRVRCDSLDGKFKKRIRFLLENAGAQAGEAALLLYIVDRNRGLQCLRQALSGRVPAAHKEAAAACVIIGSEATKAILSEALKSPNAQVQHTAACALAAFPAQDVVDSARQWFAKNDGIKQPLGKDVTVLGRTGPVFTFDEIAHANMDHFFKWSLDKLRKDFEPIFRA